MRLPAFAVSPGRPAQSSTVTVLRSPSALDLDAVLGERRSSSFLPKLNSLAKKSGSSLPANAGST